MRAVVRSEVLVAAPADAVWDYVTDWSRQAEWIPFTRVETVPGGDARGVGGRIRAWTGIGPVGFWDPMTITAWETAADGSARCEVLHTGRVVRGEAEFAVHARDATSSTFVWWERLDLPGGALGALLWRVGGGVARLAVGRALRRLAGNAQRLHEDRRG